VSDLGDWVWEPRIDGGIQYLIRRPGFHAAIHFCGGESWKQGSHLHLSSTEYCELPSGGTKECIYSVVPPRALNI